MSNRIYDYLVESPLFLQLRNKYSRLSLKDLINELENYKKFVNANYQEIKDETIGDDNSYSITSPLSLANNTTSIEEIVKGSLFLDKYIVDDPLYSQNYNDLSTQNYGRSMHGMEPLTEEKIKSNIFEACNFLKSITPLVCGNVAYVKVLPLTSHVIKTNLKSLNLPNIDTKHIDDKTFEWMSKRLKAYDSSSNEFQPIQGITNSISIAFESDELHFNAVYGELSPLIDENGNFDRVVARKAIPNKEQFNNWIMQEKIKAILDKYNHILLYHKIANELNTTTGLASIFDCELLKVMFNLKCKKNLFDLGLKLNIPYINSNNLKDIAFIREKSFEDIINFRMQLREDSSVMSMLESEVEIQEYTKEISNKYNEQEKDLSKLLEKNSKISKYIPDILISCVNVITIPQLWLSSVMNGSIAYNSIKSNKRSKNFSPYILLHKLHKRST